MPPGFQARISSQVDNIYVSLFPRVGDRARVEQICVTTGEELGLVDDISICYLQLSGHPSSVGYDSRNFSKVVETEGTIEVKRELETT